MLSIELFVVSGSPAGGVSHPVVVAAAAVSPAAHWGRQRVPFLNLEVAGVDSPTRGRLDLAADLEG